MKRILHVVSDMIFIDRMISIFESFPSFINDFLYRPSRNGEKSPLKIKKKERLSFAVCLEDYYNYFRDRAYSIIVFHGFFGDAYKTIKYIPKETKVVCWFYGVELYTNNLYSSALLPMKLYKSHTKRQYLCIRYDFISKMAYLKNLLLGINRAKEKSISRIDYACTVMPIEHEMLRKKYPNYRAELLLPHGIRMRMEKQECGVNNLGAIQVNHSAVYFNNHIDVFDALSSIDLKDREIIIPISYGYPKWAAHLKKYVKNSKFDSWNMRFLESLMPKEDYEDEIRKCSHAVFGMLRQGGIGNIYLCFRLGIKVFLYKDSMNYKQLKEEGYIVYSIEDDLNLSELNTVLSEEQIKHNYNLFYSKLDKENSKTLNDIFASIAN